MSDAEAPAPRAVRVELVGGDALGRGDRATLSWWLPEGAAEQVAYRITTDAGDDSGRIESDVQSFVEVPGSGTAQVQVWTDRGPSGWSEPAALPSEPLSEQDWDATWITVLEPERPPKGARPAYWLRSVVDVPRTDRARLRATALGLYEVFLNGVRVGDEELAPGYTQYRARVQYQTHDVTALLRPGRNVIAVLLADGWYRGQVGLPRSADQFGTDLALRLQLEGTGANGWSVIAGTDERWRAAPSHVLAADLIGGQREDRRRVEPELHDPSYADSDWTPCARADIEVAIVRPVAPPVRRVEEIAAVSVTPVGGALIVDFGQNLNGWTRLADLGPEGTAITLRHGEHRDASGDLTTGHLDINLPILPEPLPLGQVDAVVSAGRPGDLFEPRFTTHGFRYARVEGHPGPLRPDDVTAIVVGSDLRRTGWFACSDERVNRLYEAVVWSLRGNMCAIPTDCPQRERAGWTGDWQVLAPTAAFIYDVLGFTRSWLRDVRLDQHADGRVANMSPSPPAEGFDGPLGHINGSAGWGDVVVSAPWDLYEAYGDVSLLRESWDAMCAWLDHAARAAAGGRHPDRAVRRPEPAGHETYLWDTGFHWGEWLEPGFELRDFEAFAAADKSEVATAYLHRSATTMARIGRVLDADPATIARYQRIADGSRAAWQAEFVGADGTLREQTQASHVRALALGLVPEPLRAPTAARLAGLVAESGGHLATGFLSTGLLLPTLADNGHLDTAYQLLRQDTEPSWLTMIDRGATTIWERWNGVDAAGVAHDSLNHASLGAIATFLHRYVAGLRPTSPGYRTFRVQPRPGGDLTSARVSLDCPYGRIDVDWRLTSGALSLEVTVPGGTRAEVVLPDGPVHTVGPGTHALPLPFSPFPR